jgi:hypothetical protein
MSLGHVTGLPRLGLGGGQKCSLSEPRYQQKYNNKKCINKEKIFSGHFINNCYMKGEVIFFGLSQNDGQFVNRHPGQLEFAALCK